MVERLVLVVLLPTGNVLGGQPRDTTRMNMNTKKMISSAQMQEAQIYLSFDNISDPVSKEPNVCVHSRSCTLAAVFGTERHYPNQQIQVWFAVLKDTSWSI